MVSSSLSPEVKALWAGIRRTLVRLKIMHRSGQVLRRLEVSFNKCLVDDYLCADIGEFCSLPDPV